MAGDRKLKALWRWIADVERFSVDGRANVGSIDVSFYGIRGIWQATSTNANVSRPAFEMDGTVDADEIPVAVSTQKLVQRRLSLLSCGWGFGRRELEERLRKMERDGKHDKAAAWALFHSDAERAIKALNNSGVERLRLMSTALAGFAMQEPYQAGSALRDMCRSLSRELREPYLRAMFTHVASGNWHDVLQDSDLPLRDRVGIALRFLRDEELTTFLEDMTAKLVMAGDVEGVALTGLTHEGVNLFQRHVDHSGDVQTACLAMSFCVPRRFKDSRFGEWVESYRSLLDHWRMFHARAHFDIARGKHAETAADMVPPQVYVRCNYCSQSIAHSLWITGARGTDGRHMPVTVSTPSMGGMLAAQKKSTCCPDCRKPLPRCAICLLNLGTPIDPVREAMESQQGRRQSVDRPSGFDLWFTWCQTCRHGGHAIHMLEWFRHHQQCPVSDCSCQCEL